MAGVVPALENFRQQLIVAGFTGSHYDAEKVDPPAAVWFQPRAIRDLTLGGGGTLLVWVYLLALPAEDDDAAQVFGKLDDALDGFLDLGLPLADEEDAVDLMASVLLPGRQIPLPAYRLAVELDLSGES